MNRPPIALFSVVAVLGVGLAVGRAGDERATAARPATAVRDTRPVDGAVAVCPELLKEGEDVVSRLTAGVATPGEVSVRAATLTPGEGLGAVVLDQGASVGALNLKSASAVAAIITATGPQSGGLEVEQVSRGADGPNRGWAGTRCEAPTADSWFLGGTTVAGHSSQLVLVNPFDDPALVRVELYGAKGLIDVPELDGIVLKPRARNVKELANLAPDEPLLAVHVVAREGRVAPAIRVHRTRGTLPLGVDWLPRLTEPATRIDIPGIPTGNGARRLYVYVPGEDPAYLRVQLTLPDGQIVPAGFEDVRVDPGQPVVLNLADVLTVVNQRTAEKTMRPVALRIYAEGGPVFATAFADSKSRFLAIREMSFVGPAEPLTGPTLVTEARNKGKMDCALLFHAPDGPARLTIRTLLSRGEKGKSVTKVVDVPQGQLVVYPYSRLPEDPLQSVVITPEPDMAPVYASRYIFEVGRRGPLFTTQALVTQPTAGYDVPLVQSDPTAALPVRPAE
ncbi:MAG TPA: DUF5719 family protein [Frankiaceae bacterium]|nr:DUF5719 family protein [Frankiaceae bacterium]